MIRKNSRHWVHSLAEKSAIGACIADGGLGSELAFKEVSTAGTLWSARALYEQPEKIQEVHEDFLRAGAKILTTASYQLSLYGLRHELKLKGLEEQMKVLQSGTAVAAAARDNFCTDSCDNAETPLVALSIGPYAAVIGKEYDGKLDESPESIEKFQTSRLQGLLGWTLVSNESDTERESQPEAVLNNSGSKNGDRIKELPKTQVSASIENINDGPIILGVNGEWKLTNESMLSSVDIIAFETIPSLLEVRTALGSLENVLLTHNAALADMQTHRVNKLQAWITMACKDDEHLNSGDSFRDAVVECMEHAKKYGLIAGVGVNCTKPAFVSALVDVANEVLQDYASDEFEVPFLVVYPNLGRDWDPVLRQWKEIDWVSSESQFVEYAKEWSSKGVKVIGGCCQTRPSLIGKLASLTQ